MASPVTWKSARILPRLYDSIAQAMIGEGSCREIVKFKMGYGYVDSASSPPELLQVPDNLNDIPGVFFEGTPVLNYKDGRILVSCHMPNGSVTEPHHYNLTGLYDDLDRLVAVTVDLPTWVVPSDRHTAYTYIDFPSVGPNAPEAFQE